MHADCFVIGVILQSGSRVFSRRVYNCTWLTELIPFQTLMYLPAAYVRAEHFLFPCKGNELWQMGMTWTSLYLGAETRAGAREKTFLWVCLGLSLLGLFFFTLPLCNVCFVHLNNIPGTWWLLYYCIAMFKTTDNPLPLGSQPQQWSMGQILAGVSWEAAGGGDCEGDCEAFAVPEALPLAHCRVWPATLLSMD